jgi:hypothetical protein
MKKSAKYLGFVYCSFVSSAFCILAMWIVAIQHLPLVFGEKPIFVTCLPVVTDIAVTEITAL